MTVRSCDGCTLAGDWPRNGDRLYLCPACAERYETDRLDESLPAWVERRVNVRVCADDEHVYTARFMGTQRWNGFLAPYFTRAEVDRIAADLKAGDAERANAAGRTEPEGQSLQWSADDDALWVIDPLYPDETPETVFGVVINGETLYPVGGWSWAWCEANPNTPGEYAYALALYICNEMRVDPGVTPESLVGQFDVATLELDFEDYPDALAEIRAAHGVTA